MAYQFPTYRIAMWNATLLSDGSCSSQATNFVSDVIERHIYSKNSVQPAYTAALFLALPSCCGQANFSDEFCRHTAQIRSWTTVYAVIPSASACITFAGCGIVFIIGLLIAFRSRSQQSQDSLACHINAHNVSAVLADTSQFPPLLVSVGVKQQPSLSNNSSSACEPIGRFEILETTITLIDRQNMSVRKLVVGSGCKTVPDDATQIESSLVVDIKDTK